MNDKFDIGELFEKYHKDIYQFSLYFTSSVQDAEDIMQETFIKAIERSSSIKDPSKVKYWLLTIAKRTAVDHLRKKNRKSLFVEILGKVSLNLQEKSSEEQFLKRERWEEIQDALIKLKPQYRSLIILRGIKEFSVKETAEILQCSELKIRVDYHRSVKALKKELQKIDEVVSLNEKERRFNG